MCGIVGIIGTSKIPFVDLQHAGSRIRQLVQHRGPDDWGEAFFYGTKGELRSLTSSTSQSFTRIPQTSYYTPVFLGHHRLSIIDLSEAGHQPMAYAEGRFWITFNGEIYNYKELRQELESQGVKFRSGTDTEVLLSLFVREGVACLSKIRGMFAFAIWDEKNQELFFARDRFGMKPFYYGKTYDGLFAFASELKALTRCGYFSTKIDPIAETIFLQRGSIPAPQTIYRELHSLPAGHYGFYKDESLRISSYWSTYDCLAEGNPDERPVQEVAQTVREALQESVRAHQVSDVPVGLFLSGGLDSTALLASLRQFYTGPLQTMTLTFPKTKWDEGHLARKAAQKFHTDHLEMEISEKDFHQSLPDFFNAMDQPTVDGVNTFMVAKMAHKAGLKVILSGVGSDEILGGYKSFFELPRIYKILKATGASPEITALFRVLARNLPFSSAPKLDQLLAGWPCSFETLWMRYRALFTSSQIQMMKADIAQMPSSNRKLLPLFREVSLHEIKKFMVPQLLRDSDVFTMAYGLELRCPFVDHLFLQKVAAAGLWKRGNASSYKQALFQNMPSFLPLEHLRQNKKGFVLPFESWLKNFLKTDETNAFLDPLRKSRHAFWIQEFKKGRLHWSRLWALAVLEQFKTRSS